MIKLKKGDKRLWQAQEEQKIFKTELNEITTGSKKIKKKKYKRNSSKSL